MSGSDMCCWVWGNAGVGIIVAGVAGNLELAKLAGCVRGGVFDRGRSGDG